MKIVVGDSVTIIYPFEDKEPAYATTCQIMAFHAGGIKLWMAGALMDTQAARTLAEALLHAVKVVEKGRE